MSDSTILAVLVAVGIAIGIAHLWLVVTDRWNR